MDKTRLIELKNLYERTLFDNILPFWRKHAKDDVFGGYNHYLDRDGTLLSTDKSVWLNSRQLWTYSYLYNNIGQKAEWLDEARSCYDFLTKYCFNPDGKMYFQVTRDGKPLTMSSDWLTETFGLIGFAEYAKAAKDPQALQLTRKIYNQVISIYNTPDDVAQTRQLKQHVWPMLLLSTTQTVRAADPANRTFYENTARQLYQDIMRLFVKPDRKCLHEFAGSNGELYEEIAQGRVVNVGHAIEDAWFMMVEGQYWNDRKIITDAIEIMDWSLAIGWDKEFGGILNYVDINGLPPHDVIWDMKYWWPHNEAMYGLLLAHHLTGEQKYADWYEKVHAWAFDHFADPEYGEWYGYLHRDGSVLLPVKGSEWKGSFHMTRMLMLGIELLDKMIQQ